MPIVLIIAFATSMGMHALVLFGPDIDLSIASEPPPRLIAELLPPPAAELPVEAPPKPVATAAKSRAAKRKPQVLAKRAPVLNVPESPALIPETPPGLAREPASGSRSTAALAPAAPSPEALPVPAESRLPAQGMIHYRIDRGDQGFMIGESTHHWAMVDGTYRITAVTETNGLIALFKPLRIELESRGKLSAEGLVPERFVTRRKGRETNEQAEFDWDEMQVRIGKRPAQALRPGSQDLLSFHYQLGWVSDLATGTTLPIATGKKYEQYRIELIGDEEIKTPAGTFRSLHLRVPGESTTELWLAYDRSLLPVKIQHTDRDGAIYVQTATTIELSQEP
ncbi:DUF3108 domain-containing protein [Accumulibacter sp.]|uniref:DUF3108 domain-containing protein n=1 Tax=Accumulibacter sp. TaxID=2053492 RepID=UPI0028C3A9C9|nr:DUF3108 domain-containing protein [Accumulibacter sp.]